ncbi:UDP-2,3-diacylglucosamine diphosphatase LpxI [bacterium]|nr:UDP-2,3-diacylglucosamine diphosphatase LpxI [bacterium]
MPASNGGASTTLAIIAGWGRFPFAVAEGARKKGYRVVALGLEGEADPSLAQAVDRFHWTGIARLGRMVKLLREEAASIAVMAGGVRKEGMYSKLRVLRYRPDLGFFRVWFRGLTDKKDATLLSAFASFLEEQGVRVAPCAEVCPELLGPRGPLAGRKASEEEERDLAFGWGVARELARLDIGQTVLVKERAVLAVEAIEGTDAAIRRAGELCRRGGFSLVKVARPKQDMRFDVPTIGPLTIENLARAGGCAIGYEAGRTLVLEVEATAARASALGVAVVGLAEDDVRAIEERHKASVSLAREGLGAYGAAAKAADGSSS